MIHYHQDYIFPIFTDNLPNLSADILFKEQKPETDDALFLKYLKPVLIR